MPLFDIAVQNNHPTFAGQGGTTMPIMNRMRGPHALPTDVWAKLRQPWVDGRGRPCVTLPSLEGRYTRNDNSAAQGGRSKKRLVPTDYLADQLRFGLGIRIPEVVYNASLRKEDWIELDRVTLLAYRQRLRAWDDIASAVSYGGFNAMGKMTLEWYKMSDPGEAVVDMDAHTDGRTDTPDYLLQSVPLPITHSDFGYSARELAVSQNGDMPFDTTMAECSARRIAEMIEDITIGNVTGTTFGTISTGHPSYTHTGTSTVYGYRTFPQRLTKSNFTAPTGSNPSVTLLEVTLALEQLRAQFSYGPWILYHSTDWTPYMDNDYVTGTAAQGLAAPDTTLRDRIKKLDGIADVRRLDRLTATFTLLFVQMDPMVIRAINGMDLTTVQWEERGGLDLRFKTMVIQVPNPRSDYSSRTGILHGTTS